jgi:hypothetical protein
MDRQQLIKLGLLAIALVGLVYVINLYSKKQNVVSNGHMDGFEDEPESFEDEPETFEEAPETFEEAPETFEEEQGTTENFQNGAAPQGVMASDPLGQNEVFQFLDSNQQQSGEFGLSGNQYPKDCFPKDQLSPGELLPGDANSKWAQSVPAGQGELGDQNFLTAGHHVGVNTVGQTLRNANRQLRSEPPNPQVKVSPWLQTTIEADTNRRPLEIGGCQ